MPNGGSRTVVASKPDTLPTVIFYVNFDDCGTLQGPVPKRPFSANPGLEFCCTFCIYFPMHCLE